MHMHPGFPTTPDLNTSWYYLGTGIWERETQGKNTLVFRIRRISYLFEDIAHKVV